MLSFQLLSIAIILVYIILILTIYIGWKRISIYQVKQNNFTFLTSVVIAFRNEENNLSNLLYYLSKQELLSSVFEVILVNDHSEDNSKPIVENFCLQYNNFSSFDLPANKFGKKAAIDYGINKTNGKIIVLTDADCTMNTRWLKTIINYYVEFKPELISLPVQIKANKTFFSKFQLLEFLSLIGSGAGSIGIKKPILCNAANMAFEKKLYFSQKNIMNNKYASGDDIFLLLKAKKNKTGNIRFVKSKDAIVYIKPEENLINFIQQRMRWVSKSRGYNDFDILFTSLTVYMANFVVLILLILSLLNIFNFKYFIVLFLAKSLIDYLFLFSLTSFFNKRNFLMYFPITEILVIIYTAVIPILAFIQPVKWKGRKY
ncbi:MAG: glycosyltransferase [Chlorobi bacterium]|nr:glycosyltransferase [Chlorobiota bacterium]